MLLAHSNYDRERGATRRHGPITLGAHEVKRGDAVFNIPKRDVDGFIR